MTQRKVPNSGTTADQDRLLPGVSRTFALTIPQLPDTLRTAVTNAYLLCRIADTIEDDPAIVAEEKVGLQSFFLSVIDGLSDAGEFARQCLDQLSELTPAAEQDLIANTPQVVACTHELHPTQRQAIQRCLTIMCNGMSEFSRRSNLNGLPTMADLDRYCYVVAGCVGEMLTELFFHHSEAIDAKRSKLMPLAQSFGQGLQMTNILKDVWDDNEHNSCWLPRDVFAARGLDISNLKRIRHDPAFAQGIADLIGIAHGHLSGALRYTQLIPKNQSGIRNFCLWAIGLAVLTLRNINRRPTFSSRQEIKVSRRAVRGVIATSNALAGSNLALSLAFSVTARGLPRKEAGRTQSYVAGPQL